VAHFRQLRRAPAKSPKSSRATQDVQQAFQEAAMTTMPHGSQDADPEEQIMRKLGFTFDEMTFTFDLSPSR